ncbi:MAG: hypothetical protein ACPGWR_32900 [Ardenticatenaceae bacterium]
MFYPHRMNKQDASSTFPRHEQAGCVFYFHGMNKQGCLFYFHGMNKQGCLFYLHRMNK